jgi:putative peptidoglycan lipid II flippase
VSASDRAAGTAAPAAGAGAPAPRGRRIALNTLIFSLATGLSRIVGLVREILASSFFATSGAFSAFTIAFQIPNLLRMLVADQAVSAAFVPVFTDLLEQRRRKEAFQLASTLFFVILVALGTITAAFVIAAPVVMPLFTGHEFTPFLKHLTAGLSQVLFPIVVLLGLNGLTLGILYAYDEFTIPGLAPLAWNVVIIVLLLALRPLFHGAHQLYAYAIAVLCGTVVQFGMTLPALYRRGFRLQRKINLKDPRVAQVVRLMLPVTLGLGIINFDLVINSTLGSLVSQSAPRAIDAAFRIYMLPQGMFSVALATVLFPALARFASRRDYEGLRRTMANGIRQIFMLLVPTAALALVLATPIVRLIYQHGHFGPKSTHDVALALFWFSFSLPLNGANLLLTRTFFSIQRPWLPTNLALASLVVNAGVSIALYKPFGIAGLVLGTVVGNLAMVAGQAWVLRRPLRGIELGRTSVAIAQMLAAAALEGGVAYGVWRGLDELAGRSVLAQILSVGGGIVAGLLVYAGAVLLLRVPEAEQMRELLVGRMRRLRAA